MLLVWSLAVSTPEMPDSFAKHAENYYQKHPQLLSLLHDLHHRYLYLADCYSQSLKPHTRHLSLDIEDDLEPLNSVSSNVESFLSFQPPLLPPQEVEAVGSVLDVLVAQLVRELVESEFGEAEWWRAESSRKAELQGSLLEVLEAKLLMLLGENAWLGWQAVAVEEEARRLAAKVGYVQHCVGELVRCMVKLREDRRV